jgi:hypothetical protein
VQSLGQWQSSTGQDQHSLVATPAQLFVSPSASDFHLSESSPAVDAGTTQFAPPDDFEGTARPAGNGIDIGADEREGAPPANQPPSDISLSNNVVSENSAPGTVVGALTASDPDSTDTHSFTLLDNPGDLFAISGDQVVVAAGAVLDYEASASHSIVVRATDSGGLTTDKTFVINLGNINEVVSFDVQQGANQRSYLRYVDLLFESADGLAELVAAGGLNLTRFNLKGTNGSQVNIAGKVTVTGNRVTLDFGAEGIGGNRNGKKGNGYYRLSIDTDGDGQAETLRHFYRLLGDTNGDRKVDGTDLDNVNAHFGQSGTLDADVNGNGIVDEKDQNIVTNQAGRRLAAGLPLDD